MIIAAVLVSFGSKLNLDDLGTRLRKVVHYTVIVDNQLGGNPNIGLRDDQNMLVLKNDNVGGLAGAYNFALSTISERRKEVTHILFLDDDSDLDTLDSFLSSDTTVKAAACSEIAAVAPIYRDRRTGLRGRHIQLERYSFRFLSREHHYPVFVTFLINSMSLWQRRALDELGDFSVILGVDHIDTDYAMRAKTAGWKLMLNPSVEFIHEIGTRKAYKLFGKTVQSGGHNASRRFLIGKNTVLIAKYHGKSFPAFAFLCLQRIIYETIGIIFVENTKYKKLKALWSGVIFGLFYRA